ncbi:MAG: hypothetical protein R3C11_26550 [Planctomycetaceae bacterium]
MTLLRLVAGQTGLDERAEGAVSHVKIVLILPIEAELSLESGQV